MIRYLIPTLLLAAAVGCGGPATHDGLPGGPGGRPSGPPPGSGQAMDPAQRLAKTMQELTTRLKLKPAQVEKVKAILQAGEDKKHKLFTEAEGMDNPQEMEKLFTQVHQVDLDTTKALGKVLDKDQMEEYQDYLKEQRRRLESGRDKSGGPPGGGPPGGGQPGGRPGGM